MFVIFGVLHALVSGNQADKWTGEDPVFVMFGHILNFLKKNCSLQASGNDNPNQTDSDRFLANFFLFLMQPCGQLKVEDKSRLISEFLPKLSTIFIEEPVHLLGDDENKSDDDTSSIDFVGPAMIGLDAMQRANSTLEDFCRSYFMFHGVDINRAESIFRYLPVLSFTESYIYQLDTFNEKMLGLAGSRATCLNKWFNSEAHYNWASKFIKVLESDPFCPLTGLLEQLGLLTERIREELRNGEEYWALERKLCGALSSKLEIVIGDVMRAIHMKSFDYRVLNLLLYQLRREEVNELHMEFLSVSEFLVEVADDLTHQALFDDDITLCCVRFDYEEDVLENNFNILRMFVRIYGTSMAPTMLAKYITEAEEKYSHLLKGLDPPLSLSYRRRCEEATKEGGSITGYSLGSWTIPPLIADEELYRCTFQNPE
ncbi:hypothetical protein Nepgr_007779 [Nepenthes gracilis]|uniref:Uncharacterized protein n=1 Tax=Nepenthes gracilis TaxID=150966 RepID=A0AAD3XIN0_NEPGR|nr:hypothetical protein Nepgr_007779 [Nepenthes gracilis]